MSDQARLTAEDTRKREADHREYMRALYRRVNLQRLDESGARLRKSREALQASERRREEMLAKRALELRFDIRRACKAAGYRAPVPLAEAQRIHQMRIEQRRIVSPEDAPLVAAWRGQIEADARQLGVEILWEPRCAGLNSYALTATRRIEIAPPTTVGLYVAGLHELGHIARPCQKTHTRTTTRPGDTNCVVCELAAWSWAIQHAKPTWSRAAHDRLASSLSTYRPYAPDGSPEQRELDRMVSPLGFRFAQLANLQGDER